MKIINTAQGKCGNPACTHHDKHDHPWVYEGRLLGVSAVRGTFDLMLMPSLMVNVGFGVVVDVPSITLHRSLKLRDFPWPWSCKDEVPQGISDWFSYAASQPLLVHTFASAEEESCEIYPVAPMGWITQSGFVPPRPLSALLLEVLGLPAQDGAVPSDGTDDQDCE